MRPTLIIFLAALLLAVPIPNGSRANAQTEPQDWRRLCADPKDQSELATCEAAVMSRPDDPAALHRLAILFLTNFREVEALDLYDRLTQLEPENAETYFEHATALATVWAYQPAVTPIVTAIRLSADEPRYYQLAAIIYEQLGRPSEAFVVHLRLARLGDSGGMYDVARDYEFGRGTEANGEAAREWYEQAATLHHVGAMDALAEAYSYGGLALEIDPDKAAYWQRRAAEARGGELD